MKSSTSSTPRGLVVPASDVGDGAISSTDYWHTFHFWAVTYTLIIIFITPYKDTYQFKSTAFQTCDFYL